MEHPLLGRKGSGSQLLLARRWLNRNRLGCRTCFRPNGHSPARAPDSS
jgi:hypothetical protein